MRQMGGAMKHIFIKDALSGDTKVYIDGSDAGDCEVTKENLSVFVRGMKVGEIFKLENRGNEIEVWVK
jgi:hypothetical protein